jgi:uncharacterized protein YkwD
MKISLPRHRSRKLLISLGLVLVISLGFTTNHAFSKKNAEETKKVKKEQSIRKTTTNSLKTLKDKIEESNLSKSQKDTLIEKWKIIRRYVNKKPDYFLAETMIKDLDQELANELSKLASDKTKSDESIQISMKSKPTALVPPAEPKPVPKKPNAPKLQPINNSEPAPNPVPAPTPTPTLAPTPPPSAHNPIPTPPQTNNLSISDIANLVNNQRTQNNLSAIPTNALLNQAAQAKAKHMSDNNYFEHCQADLCDNDFVTKEGYRYQAFFGNIAKGYMTSQSVVDGWMNSEGHRANILAQDATEMGIGFYGQYIVLFLAKPLS